jgi:hypothetical protein
MTNPLFADQADLEDHSDQGDVDVAAELIGEGKKYKDLSAAAKALLEKDRFIERLKAENAEVRASLQGEEKMDAFLEKLRAAQNSGTASNSVTNQGEPSTNQNQSNNQTPSKALTVEEVQKLMEDRERTAAEQRNLESSIARVRDTFGANYKAVMTAKADELGMSQDYLLNLAKTQPKAFAKLIDADVAQQGRGTTPTSSVNTAALGGKRTGEKNNEYYKTLRKQIGDAKFFQPNIQNQLHKDAQRLGEAFFS